MELSRERTKGDAWVPLHSWRDMRTSPTLCPLPRALHLPRQSMNYAQGWEDIFVHRSVQQIVSASSQHVMTKIRNETLSAFKTGLHRPYNCNYQTWKIVVFYFQALFCPWFESARIKIKKKRLTCFCYAGVEFALSIQSIPSRKIPLNEWAGVYLISLSSSFQNDFVTGSKQGTEF